VNRNFKAGIFSHLFGDAESERGLYNAFSPVHQSIDAEVVDLTLEDVLFMDKVNDLAFSIGGSLVCFFEAQSTINDNMAVRYLIYGARVYEKLIDNKAMYNTKRFIIPTPEFYVLYTGVRPFPEKKIYRLSDSFALPPGGDCQLELIVTAYNINKGFNEDIVRKDENLYGYVTFISKVRENEQHGMERAKAVEEAIKDCIKLGVLAEYLTSHGSEVANMVFQEWNWDDALSVREQEARESERSLWEAVLADKDAELADKDAALSDKDAEIAALKEQLKRMSPNA